MVIAGDMHPLTVEQASPLACIGKPDDVRCSGDSGKEGTAEQSLEVDRQVGLPVTEGSEPGHRTEPSGHSPELVTGEENRLRDSGVPLDKRPPRGLDEPAQLRVGPVRVDRGDYGDRMDDISERTRLHQQDALRTGHGRFHDPVCRRSASLSGRPAARTAAAAALMSYSTRRNQSPELSSS